MLTFTKRQLISALIIISAFMVVPVIGFTTSGVIDDPAQPDSAIPTIGENAPPSIAEGDVAKLIRYLYLFGLAAAGLAAMGALIYGGVLYLTAGGSQGQVTKGKNRIYGALYGVGLILVSFIILYTINPALVSFTNPAMPYIKLIHSSFWSLSSYGKGNADTPENNPCHSDWDCRYDLACCPPGAGQCEQDLSTLPANKTRIIGQAKNEWFVCGNIEEASWDYYPAKNNQGCPAPYVSAGVCDPSNNTGTACCDANAKPTERPEMTILCCKPPSFMTAMPGECEASDGKVICNKGTDKAYTLCDQCGSQCGEKTATCQKMLKREGTTQDLFIGKHSIDDKLGGRCYYNYDWVWNYALDILFKKDTPRDSCRDYRLVCNQFHNVCLEPGEVGTLCKYDTDCCQKYDNWTPQCRKYTDRDISLVCDPTDMSCVFKKKDQGKLEDETPKPSNYECQIELTEGKTCADYVVNDVVYGKKYPDNDEFTILADSDAWCGKAGEKLIQTHRQVGTDAKCCCKQISTPFISGTLDHNTAVSQLQQSDINVKTGADAADLSGIHQEVISELIDLKADCKCDITVTEGTGGTHESGVCSHENGWKADVRLNDGLNTFLSSQTSKGIRSDGAPMYQHNNAIYAKKTDHWDMQFLCQNL